MLASRIIHRSLFRLLKNEALACHLALSSAVHGLQTRFHRPVRIGGIPSGTNCLRFFGPGEPELNVDLPGIPGACVRYVLSRAFRGCAVLVAAVHRRECVPCSGIGCTAPARSLDQRYAPSSEVLREPSQKASSLFWTWRRTPPGMRFGRTRMIQSQSSRLYRMPR